MTAKEEEKKILACQLHFSMNVFFPSPPHLFWPPWVFFCFTWIRLPLSFYSISRIQEERKKEMAWPQSYQNLTDPFVGWRVQQNGRSYHFGRGGHILVVQAVVGLLATVGSFFCRQGLLFSLVRHSKWMLRDTWALVWVQTNWQTVRNERMVMGRVCYWSFSQIRVLVSQWNYIVHPLLPRGECAHNVLL